VHLVRPALALVVALAACALDALACSSTCEGKCPVPIAVRVQRTARAPFDQTTYVIEIQADTDGVIVTCAGPSPSALSCDHGAQVESGAIYIGFSTTPAAVVVTVRDGAGNQLAHQTFTPTYAHAQVCSSTCSIADDQVVEIP
jgi:hypothetical protein